MSSFRTQLIPDEFSFRFDHQTPTLCIGSCFAEHIFSKLDDHKIPALLNPFGILYNPYSIAHTLESLIGNSSYSKEVLFEQDGLWHSFDHHGVFSDPNRPKALNHINQKIQEGHDFLLNAKRLILTFGTSNVFVFKKSGKIVANCHKVPNDAFDRSALSVDQMITQLSKVIELLQDQHSQIEILLTVSPVRHIRDGLIENQRSKARLLLVASTLAEQYESVHYFPSYEIMMDDLRDYRFYEKDMIHPSSLAIDYIWELFQQSFFSIETKELCQKIKKIRIASTHRPFHPASEAHQAFLRKQINHIRNLEGAQPHLDFKNELALFESQLTSAI